MLMFIWIKMKSEQSNLQCEVFLYCSSQFDVLGLKFLICIFTSPTHYFLHLDSEAHSFTFCVRFA
jgi:hypothetical protein